MKPPVATWAGRPELSEVPLSPGGREDCSGTSSTHLCPREDKNELLKSAQYSLIVEDTDTNTNRFQKDEFSTKNFEKRLSQNGLKTNPARGWNNLFHLHMHILCSWIATNLKLAFLAQILF